MNRRSPYLESFAIFTKLKTSMQAAGHPEHSGCVAPFQASNGSPMAGGTSARPGARVAAAAGGGGGPGESAPGGGGCYPPPAVSCVCIPEQDH